MPNISRNKQWQEELSIVMSYVAIRFGMYEERGLYPTSKEQ